MPLRAPPFSVRDIGRSDAAATPVAPNLVQYPGVLTSIDALDSVASGRGLISVDPEGGVIRRIPLVASVGGTLVPALAIEMLRVRLGVPSCPALLSGPTVQGIAIGDIVIPTEADGAVRIYYSHRRADRFVSAIDVLEGKVDPASPANEARADRLDGSRPARIPEHPTGRAHARQRNPCATPREPLRRHAAAPTRLGTVARGGALPHARQLARVCHTELETAQRGAADGRRCGAARGRRVRRLSRPASALRCGDARRRAHAAVRRAARADARGGDPAEEGAGANRSSRARRDGSHCRRARSGAPDSDRDAATRRSARRRCPNRHRGDHGPGAGNRRRSVRLLPPRRAPPVFPRRRRCRQGTLGEHLHGGQQGTVQERDAARP